VFCGGILGQTGHSSLSSYLISRIGLVVKMKGRPRAAARSHKKNIYCPFYRECLDHAAKRHWKSWDCSRCPYKSKKVKEDGLGVPGTGDESFELPGSIVRTVTGKTGSLD
jgi:hypothetical protein